MRTRNWYIAIACIAFLLVSGVAAWFAIALWAPAPPRSIEMTTGAPGDAYHAYGERYREILAKSGIGVGVDVERLAQVTALATG